MYNIMTGANGNTRIIYEYICDTEADIESLPTDKAPAKATCIGSGHVFYLVAAGGEFAYAGSETAAKAATPAASVGAGAIAFPTNITLSTTTPTAKIYYTTNGSTPTSGSTEYTEAIEVSSAITLKAIAIADGYSDSNVMSEAYTQAQAATPTISPAAGAKVLPFNVTLACATAGAAIYYTVDGSTPDDTKTLYEAPFEVASALTVKAIAIAEGYTNSAVASAAYTQAKVATPAADPEAGEVAADTEIALTCATAGAAIYYTTDGSAPNATKTLYDAESKPVITVGVTIKAIGILAGYANSSVLTAIYTVAT